MYVVKWAIPVVRVCLARPHTHADSGQAADLGRYCYRNLLVWNSVCWTESHTVALQHKLLTVSSSLYQSVQKATLWHCSLCLAVCTNQYRKPHCGTATQTAHCV